MRFNVSRSILVLALLPTAVAFAGGLPSVPKIKVPAKESAPAAEAAKPAAAQGPQPVKDEGVTSPVHEANVGRIVFATSSQSFVIPEKTDTFKTSFAAGEGVYPNAYLPRSFENAFREQGVQCGRNQQHVWRAWVDGTELAPGEELGFFSKPGDAWQTDTTIRIGVPLTQSRAMKGELAHALWARGASQLTPGEHTVRLALSGVCDDVSGQRVALARPLAEGEVSFEVPAAAAPTGKLPPAALTDAKLSGDMAAVMKAKWPGDEILNVVITQPKWTVEVHKLSGLPLSRTIGTAVAVRQQSGCAYFDVTFIQTTSDGGTSYGPTQYNSVGERHAMACETAN